MAGAPSACRTPRLHTPLPQACIAITVQHAVSVATCLGSAPIAAKSAPQPSASPSALKLIVSGSCEWPELVGLREVCGEFVEGRLFSRLAATAAVTTAPKDMATLRFAQICASAKSALARVARGECCGIHPVCSRAPSVARPAPHGGHRRQLCTASLGP